MRRTMLAALVGGALTVPVLTAGGAVAQTQSTGFRTIVVQLKSSSVRASAVLSNLPGTPPKAESHNRYWFRVPSSDVSSVLSRLQGDARVTYATVSHPVHATATPNDPCYTVCPPIPQVGRFDNSNPPNEVADPGPVGQAYLNTIDAPAAWDITKGDGQVVAVLDSGVDQANPDLVGKIRTAQNICYVDNPACGNSGGQASDDNGHGTHVSGIIAADTDNRTGVAGLGWNVRVDMYKVLDNTGAGIAADVATAIYDAVDAGVRVINMSLANFSCPAVNYDPSQCGPDLDEAKAVEFALSQNVVVVAAAGNDGYDSPTFPAGYPGVLSVAATDNAGTIQCFSQWGSSANIAAPGVGIVSTWNGSGGYSYFVLDGTSMAAPQVAAAAALMIAHNPHLSSPQITQIMEDTATPVGTNGTCGGSGGFQPPANHNIYGGLLNVAAALNAESNRPPTRYNGYDMVGTDGGVYPFGGSIFAGDSSGTHLNQPVVGMARTADGLGYWLVARDGGIFTYGDAKFFGSTGAIHLNQPIVGMAEDPATGGYWLVAADGGIFSFNAPFYGSTGAIHLNKPVVGMAAMPDGSGYWLVASDGGIFTFGNAGFYGSTGAIRLNKPVVGMSPTASGQGYWLVASDGGIFTFGNAGFHGSTGAIVLNRPIVAMTTTPSGGGYTLFATDGGVFTFGDSRFYGSLGAISLPAPIAGASN